MERAVLNRYEAQQFVNPITIARVENTRVEQEDVFERFSLSELTGYLRENWEMQGLPKNYTDLPGVGFLIGYQMGFLDSEKFKDLDPQQKKQRWTETTEFSLRGWVREYLEEALTFPGEYELANVGGQVKLRDTRHGAGLFLEDTISKKDRKGSAWRSRVEVTTPFLATAPDGSFVVLQSPKGPSGIPDDRGVMFNYPDSHYEIMVKKGDRVFSYTVKTDFELSEHREATRRLMRLTNQPYKALSKDSPLEDYVMTVPLFNSETSTTTIKDVIDVLKDTRFDATGGSLYAFKKRMWAEVYRDMDKDIEDLWRYNEKTDWFIKEFVDFSLYSRCTRDELQEALAITILRLSKHVLRKEKEKSGDIPYRVTYGNRVNVTVYEHGSRKADYLNPNLTTYTNSGDSFGSVFKEMKTKVGCAGGEGEQGLDIPGYAMSATAFIEGLKKGSELEFDCPMCGEITKGEIGNECPHCHKTKDDWIKIAKAKGKKVC
jgi:hypothetical protein